MNKNKYSFTIQNQVVWAEGKYSGTVQNAVVWTEGNYSGTVQKAVMSAENKYSGNSRKQKSDRETSIHVQYKQTNVCERNANIPANLHYFLPSF